MPVLAKLTPTLLEAQARWREADRATRMRIYVEDLVPEFAELFAGLPLDGAPEGLPKPEWLVSVLGFSWQPLALLARWAKPRRMLIIGTTDSFEPRNHGHADPLARIAEVSGLAPAQLAPRRVPDSGEAEIYRCVKEFLRESGVDSKRTAIDPTGGKKSMSVAAGLAGFLEGVPLIYVDNGEYESAGRAPVPGSEYPRLLTNPLEVFGDAELERIRSLLAGGHFSEASHRASDLADRLYEPREAEALQAAAEGYGAWEGFRFRDARDGLARLAELLDRYGRRSGWSWAATVERALPHHLHFLKKLAALEEAHHTSKDRQLSLKTIEDGAPLLLNHLAAARRAIEQGRLSIGLMLTYSAMERYVDLCLWVLFGLDDERPDYGLLGDRLDREQYNMAGKNLLGNRYELREMSGPIQFMSGIQLLAALAPDRLPNNPKELGPLYGLSSNRNKCEYEHGLMAPNLDGEKVMSDWRHVRSLILRGLGDADAERWLERLSFPAYC